MTESLNDSEQTWLAALWSWRDLARGSDPPQTEPRRIDITTWDDAALSQCESSLFDIVRRSSIHPRACRCLTGFFGIGEVPATHAELARETGVSTSSVEKDVRAAIRLLAATESPPAPLCTGNRTERPAAVADHFRSTPAELLSALLRAWRRLRPGRRDTLVVGSGLAWWHARLAPYSTVLTTASVAFPTRKQAQRARYAAFNVLRIELARAQPAPAGQDRRLRTSGRLISLGIDTESQSVAAILDHVEHLLDRGLLDSAEIALYALSLRERAPTLDSRYRRLIRTALRLRGHTGAALMPVRPDGPLTDVVSEVIDASLARTYALGDPERAADLLRKFIATNSLSLNGEMRVHLYLALIDASHGSLAKRRRSGDLTALAVSVRRILMLIDHTDDLLSSMTHLTSKGPVGGGNDPQEMRTGLHRRRADILRKLVVANSCGDTRLSTVYEHEIRDLWEGILNDRHLLRGHTLIQSLDSELAFARELPNMAPRPAHVVARDLLDQRTAFSCGQENEEWRTFQAESLLWLLTRGHTADHARP